MPDSVYDCIVFYLEWVEEEWNDGGVAQLTEQPIYRLCILLNVPEEQARGFYPLIFSHFVSARAWSSGRGLARAEATRHRRSLDMFTILDETVLK